MINLTKYELKLIAGNRGIKNYQNMSKEKLLNAIIKSECITEIYRKMDLSESQECRISHRTILSKSQKCKIYFKINSSKSRKQDVLKITKICRKKIY